MPSVQEFANRMGYSSTSSAHCVLQQLLDEGYVAKTETGRLQPGEQFFKAGDRPLVPAELLRVLPVGEGLRVMQVGPDWVTDDSIQPGDYLVLGPAEAGEEGDRFVLSRGAKYAVPPRLTPGWKNHGTVLGIYRSHVKTDRA